MGLGLPDYELITSVTLLAMSCMIAVASFPSGRTNVYQGMRRKI